MLGGYGIAGAGVWFKRKLKLPKHKRMTIRL